MDTTAALSFLDGSLTVAGGAAALPGTSLTLGTQANKEPEFFVTDGADVAVQFAWRMATTVDGMARTEVTGKNPVLVPSKLRNTGGGGGADLVVGQAGAAELLVSGGGNVDFSDDVILGDLATAIGTAQVDGVANGVRSTMRTRGGANSVIYVGRRGSGSLDVTDGALVSSAGDISIADQANSSGQLHVFQTDSPDDGGFPAEVATVDDLFVGGGGFGNLLIDTGGHVEVGDALIINNATSRVEMNGGTFRAARLVHTSGGAAILNFGRGELIGSGTAATSPLTIGNGSAGPMELVVTSTGSAAFGATTIAANGTLEVAGQVDIAALSVSTGGRLLVSGRVNVDQLNSTSGTYALESGTLAVTQTQFPVINNPVTVGGTSNVEVPSGGSLILGGVISGSGGAEKLVKTGAGALALRGTTTLAGPLVVQAGRLLSDADSLPAAIENNAELVFQQLTDGTYAGTISGAGNLMKDSPGLLTLTRSNSYTGDTVVDEGTLRIQQPYLHDLADVYVNINAVLSLDFIGVDTIDALFFDGFSQPVGTYGSVGSGAIFQSARFSGVGLLEVMSSVGLPGDYHADGVVDGSDFLTWQRGGSPNPLSEADLALWEANYGSNTPLSAFGTNVPEPSGMILMLAMCVVATWPMHR
jgi:autotransporter-associated beta strand protein/T5SS/PEP-CTERM-associated repeat protein